MGDHPQNQEAIMIAKSTDQEQQQEVQDGIMDPTTTTYLLYHAPSCTTTTTPFCCCCCSNSNTSMKRRSPSPSSSGATTTEEHRACKKLHFREQGLITPFHNSPPDQYLSKGFVCDPSPTPTPTPSPSPDKGLILTKEDASNSMRLRRMKDCLREMRKCWDEVMREEEEEEEYEDNDEPEGVEGDKEQQEDDCGGRDAKEAVRVEWAEKCLSICFKCPCTKAYQILLSGNNCYYKLL